MWLLITLVSKSKLSVAIGISWVQLLYTGYLIIQRPFSTWKENFIEIMNEIFFCAFAGLLFHFNSKDNWTQTVTTTYVWMLTANNLMVLVVMAGNYFSCLYSHRFNDLLISIKSLTKVKENKSSCKRCQRGWSYSNYCSG